MSLKLAWPCPELTRSPQSRARACSRPQLSLAFPPQLLDKREPLRCQQPGRSTLGHQHVGPESPDRKGHCSELGLPGLPSRRQ